MAVALPPVKPVSNGKVAVIPSKVPNERLIVEGLNVIADDGLVVADGASDATPGRGVDVV